MLEARPFWMKAECHYQDLTVAPFDIPRAVKYL